MQDFVNFIENYEKKNLQRKLVNSDIVGDCEIIRKGKKIISFASNDYFNLSQNNQVKKAAKIAIEKYGVGSGSSRYVSGNSSLYSKLEKQISKINKTQDSIVFTSGYQAAIGTIPALVGKGDLVISDRLIHSCLIDGVKLSGAKLLRFRHNDFKHCESLIKENKNQFKKILIITEEVFSMDGDIAPIFNLKEIARKYNAILFIDKAHSLYNHNMTSEEEDYIIQMGTLSKSVGALGGYIAAGKDIIQYLRNFAKSAIYTTALPASILAASIQSFKIINKKNFANKVLSNANYFCEIMNLPMTKSAIVIIEIGDNKKVLQIAKYIENQGFLIAAIRPPTVENNRAIIRITFSVKHKPHQIRNLAMLIKKRLLIT